MPLAFGWLFQRQKDINHRVFVTSQEKCLKQRGRKYRFEIYKRINSICNKEQLYEEWKEWMNVLINMKGNKRVFSN